ncbi:hypothetical protein [Kibdelosporangium phytohabitans]|uniref:Uncharacterized protein n=1 Tax=Kibdelosporangium phytohabitans TaxID=860235 RepID=A0A0N9IE80_9PSEU|nr:hypothetical protein [Kibdelosporangium phytohabitans]ALG13072.1 hypothetical protein AOZ06_45000 [Kibdelosporangium phytohabitans]MBE1464810.1 hypothetical protein [Kibdelosporangium phytohabitans]
MGLDAFVMCRCWQDGLTSTPPFPAEWLEVQDNEVNLVEPHNTLENDIAVDTWRHDACAHTDMEAAAERLANWSHYRLFREALATVGWHHFPVLKAELPEANGGEMPASASAEALTELAHFDSQESVGTRTYLADEDTGVSVMVYVAAYRGETFVAPGLCAGMTPDGFFVIENDREVFNAKRFQQVIDDKGTRLAADGQEVAWPFDLFGTPPAKNLHITTRTLTPKDFEPITASLRKVCEVSVATGNPVAWC